MNIVEDQRKVESEVKMFHLSTRLGMTMIQLTRLLHERLKLVLQADVAWDAQERGDHFPYPSVEEHAAVCSTTGGSICCTNLCQQFVQTQRERLTAVATLAFLGAGKGVKHSTDILFS